MHAEPPQSRVRLAGQQYTEADMRRRTDLLREDEAPTDAHLAQESDYEANVLVFQHR